MKYLRQLAIILSAYFLGELLRIVLHIPIPGNVLGMLLLFAGLCSGFIKIEMIEEVGEFLLSHLSFFFIPAGVGLIASFGILKGNLLAIMTICALSTAIVLLTTAWTVNFFRRNK